MIKVTPTNSNNQITVKDLSGNINITTTGNLAEQHSRISQAWATSEEMVQGVDYSSKHYASTSKEYSEQTLSYRNETINAVSGFQNLVDSSKVSIKDVSQECLDNIETSSNGAVQVVQDICNSSVDTINTTVNEGIAELEDRTNDLVSEINTTGKSYDNLTHKQITNCLLEVPQNIKLELANGTLTLKAGSKVIVPNGFEADGTTLKFDEVEITSDLSYNSGFGTASTDAFILYNNTSKTITYVAVSIATSGTTAPTGTGLWYDTTNNKVKYYNSGSASSYSFAFPLAVITREEGVITGIKQVLNGMGYIGSTIWVDKGVKGLIPNGRNEDGTLKNIEITTNNLVTSTSSSTQDYTIRLSDSGSLAQRQARYSLVVSDLEQLYKLDTSIAYYVYVISENKAFLTSGSQWVQSLSTPIATATLTQGVVSNFQPKQPFRAVDFSDSSTVSGWGMPSNRYVDLTLGANGSTYTAPANGYVVFGKASSGAGQYINLSSGYLTNQVVSYANGNILSVYIPVTKGKTFKASYSVGGTINSFRFIYAEGDR